MPSITYDWSLPVLCQASGTCSGFLCHGMVQFSLGSYLSLRIVIPHPLLRKWADGAVLHGCEPILSRL